MDNRSAATAADRFFRHEAGRMIAPLTRLLGPRYFDLAEDAMQDAMCAALETWKFHGIPRAPEAWLMRGGAEPCYRSGPRQSPLAKSPQQDSSRSYGRTSG